MPHLPTLGHALADEISKYFNEPEKFKMYLQFVRRLGHEQVRLYFSETKRAEVDDKKRLFMYKCSARARGLQNN